MEKEQERLKKVEEENDKKKQNEWWWEERKKQKMIEKGETEEKTIKVKYFVDFTNQQKNGLVIIVFVFWGSSD